jgi:hypothetical protein
MEKQEQEMPLRPFHETIIDAINMIGAEPRHTADDVDSARRLIAFLIKTTKIPKGHDQIIDAWEKRMARFGWVWPDPSIKASLLKQKEIAAIEAAAPKCDRCKDTGKIYIKNQDWPCDCHAGDHALFSVPGVDGGLTGIEMRKHIKMPEL